MVKCNTLQASELVMEVGPRQAKQLPDVQDIMVLEAKDPSQHPPGLRVWLGPGNGWSLPMHLPGDGIMQVGMSVTMVCHSQTCSDMDFL
jgi:hypothetical protein